MIWKSRQRLVIFLLGILIATIGTTLGIIYFTTYAVEKKKNMEMLSMFADKYEEAGMPRNAEPLEMEEEPKPPKGEILLDEQLASGTERREKDGHRYEISTFYAVAFQADGTAAEYLNDESSGLSDEELIAAATEIKNGQNEYGQGDGLIYLVTRADNYTLVSLMDTSVVDDTIRALIRHMILFGFCSIIFLSILTFFLSKWIMKPAAVAYEKQKRFISDAGHELKTPIATISANAELLTQEVPDNRWLENIVYENNRMSAIVHELLDMARLESVRPVMELLDFSTLCMAAVMPFEAEAFERGIEMSYAISENIKLTGNQADLEKLVGILTDNAISHCQIPGRVQIDVTHVHDKIKLVVSNTGNPLSKEECSNVFERFYRNDKARTEKDGHYGLGLSIARSIVLAHKGSIHVKCQNGNVIFEVLL